jgi:AraC family cel operon transcriptional repressor
MERVLLLEFPGRLDYAVQINESVGDYGFERHGHLDYCEFVYVKSGYLEQVVNGRRVVLPPGTLTFVRQQDVHELTGRDLHMVNVVLPTSLMNELLPSDAGNEYLLGWLLRAPGPVTAPVSSRQAFAAALEELLQHQGSNKGSLVFRRFLYGVLVDCFLPVYESRERESAEMPSWLQDCLSEVERRPDMAWKIEDLVRLCSRTREHVSRCFRRYLQVSPSQFVNARRLERAERLLRYTNRSISQICYQVGFNNLNYFHRLFRERNGATPRAYRERYKDLRLV